MVIDRTQYSSFAAQWIHELKIFQRKGKESEFALRAVNVENFGLTNPLKSTINKI